MAAVSKRDYYETLGVDRNVSDDELKKAYRKLARQHHPDLHTGEQQKKSAEEKFKEINEAYETLSDQEKRKRYDMFGHAGAQQGGPGFDGFDFGRGGFGDVFNDIFEDFFGQARAGGGGRAERGNDLQYNLEVTFEESVYGKEAKLKIPRWELCTDCKGTGAKSAAAIKPCASCKGAGQIRFQQGFFSVSRPCGQCEGTGHLVTEPCATCQGRQRVYKERAIAVHIPAGIETGMRLRLSNEGEHGPNGGPPGDLYVAITVKPHQIFQRKGLDIACDVPINLVTAVLGGKVEVPTLKGDTVIKVPPGTQHDKVLRIKGLGIPSLKGGTTGDQTYTMKIQIPTKLTARQKELLMEYAKESGMSMEANGDGFFDKMKTFFE
ncbi:chaperone Hsp40, co-chaperone with DnaK [Candidatus Nitrospira nitrosa]|uniref:Chaperone protein DnaJ n=1 Tax=Candidatus Nitrospira nitrosa TaxID=1742972 RepID=A0A0S4LRR3_9BACT|nr:molecular chaperone DnaJ [Candidatus Nitrospira nitrosa]CUS39370.1 chaperone Hsp40, co-chaperone with DnaK [Candidatus Nitrospira nitrosa]